MVHNCTILHREQLAIHAQQQILQMPAANPAQENLFLSLLANMAIQISHLPVRNDFSFCDHIESITHYQFVGDEVVRFYPEGRVELLFQFGSSFLHRSSVDKSWIIRPVSFVGGLHDRIYHVKPMAKNAYCLGIKFKPDTARYFIPLGLHRLTNRVVSLSDLWGKESTRSLTKVVSNATDINVVLLAIERFLSAQYNTAVADKIEKICKEIEKHPGTIPIRQLANKSDLSYSHFRKIFNEQIGLAPKPYSKILRVNLALSQLRDKSFVSLTALAHSLGYYDQAHFIREFKSITDLTPRQYLQTSR